MPDVILTLSVKKRVSIFFTSRDSHIYESGDQILSGTGFEKYFSAALPFYQPRVFMANKYKNYNAAKQLQEEDSGNERFFKPSFYIIITV